MSFLLLVIEETNLTRHRQFWEVILRINHLRDKVIAGCFGNFGKIAPT